MTGQKILYAVIGLAVGALAGFYFANSANRKELDNLRAELTRAKSSPQQQQQSPNDARNVAPSSSASGGAQQQMPSEQEIRDLIAKADARSDDGDYQQKVGKGVYMYSLAQNAPALMPEAIRLLTRAEAADPKNFQTLLLLGNANFALAQDGDAHRYADARAYYQRAVELKPDDSDAHTLLGMTYYFASPSDPQRAIAEYRKTLAKDPRHEMALQNISSALIAAGALREAEQRIGELEKVNPNNNKLANLRAQLAQAKNAQGGK
ncbi:MAG: tetratricopeptide repeat protein [Acidobacteria bacterium]|nr:tetratricopeptide repeat protein [Acidobacteriota bacterium]